MVKRAIDARLVVMESSKKDQDIIEIMEKLKEFLGIESETEIIKSCIRKSYDLFYKKLIEKNKS